MAKLNGSRPMSKLEMNDLTQRKDAAVVETICRVLGRTDWEMNDKIFKRGRWMEYPDGEEVFSFDGKEKFLLGPIVYNIIDNTYGRRLEWLFDRKEVVHHTAEDERG